MDMKGGNVEKFRPQIPELNYRRKTQLLSSHRAIIFMLPSHKNYLPLSVPKGKKIFVERF